MPIQIYRKMDGYLEYLAKNETYWTREESEAAEFSTREEARIAREKIAGPVPARDYGTYPNIFIPFDLPPEN